MKTIVAQMKKQERQKAGKNYTPSKHDTAPSTAINWKSPMFWPMIEMAAQQQVGKPNLTKLVEQLQWQDPHLKHFSHRQISEWRDKSVSAQFFKPFQTFNFQKWQAQSPRSLLLWMWNPLLPLYFYPLMSNHTKKNKERYHHWERLWYNITWYPP